MSLTHLPKWISNTIHFIIFGLIIISISNNAFAQAGITSSPARLYYRLTTGNAGTNTLVVENPLDKELEVGVSIGDWKYDTTGENKFYDAGELKASCAAWLSLPDGTYFTLKAHERKEMKVIMKAPANADTSVPVHTAMLYLTQLNPGDAVTDNGAAIKVTVRMATKIYHSFSSIDRPNLEIMDFREETKDHTTAKGKNLQVAISNTGRLWVDGTMQIDLLNNSTGKKVKLSAVKFYSLPGDYRMVSSPLPADIAEGHYTATAVVKYDAADELKLAELELDIAK